MEKDGQKANQKKYHEKVTAEQPLHPDAGGLGRNRTSYDEKIRSGRDPQRPLGSTDKAHVAYGPKARDKYRGGRVG